MPHLQLDAEPPQQGEPGPGPQLPQAAQVAGHQRALGHTGLGTGVTTGAASPPQSPTAVASPPGSPTAAAAPHLVALANRVEVPGFHSSGEQAGQTGQTEHWAVNR